MFTSDEFKLLRHLLSEVGKVQNFPSQNYLLQKPTLSLRRKKSIHKIVVGLIRDLEGFFLDISEDSFQHIWGQVFARVDSFILFDELFSGDLHLGVGIVKSSVEHDDGEGEDEASVRLLKDVRILTAIMRSKAIHHPINLHGFTR